eukprot:TRINITY_DN6550_c0_g1_i1.p1 TRINITY_DN6550_c0_g1~~TRINITY_DN6550_c0_g1_i1.p1  ORF type:complete len:1001 (-),score=245.57 TRINITY_DN6550_c0_g1_i1:15-2960(-)
MLNDDEDLEDDLEQGGDLLTMDVNLNPPGYSNVELELEEEEEHKEDELRDSRTQSRSEEAEPGSRRRTVMSIVVGFVVFVVLLGLVISVISSKPTPEEGTTDESWRLPNTTIPSHYDLYISTDPDFTRFVFTGTVYISISILEPIDRVTLHSANLQIQEATITSTDTSKDQTPMAAKNITTDPIKDFLFLDFNERLSSGNYTLRIQFQGKIASEPVGFYRSSYKYGGKKHWIGLTQFESTFARWAFPCFDETALKATFAISIEANEGQTILSNMPSSNVIKNQGRQKVVFQQTPVMSSYLVAFVVGDLESVNAVDAKQRPVAVWTALGKKSMAEFALNFTLDVVPKMEEYFGIDYALPKIDLVAVPDFEGGAMENWGLITFLEDYLLLDDQATQSDYSDVADTVSHELVHQWTGDLVTCAWWSDLWLNEGFAQYYEPFFTYTLYPSWKETNQYAIVLAEAMDDDSLITSHPIVLPIDTPDESQEIFDDVTYRKGSSLIRMVSAYLDRTKGENTWRNGLRSYLKKYQYSNAFTKDLFDSIGGYAKIPDLAALMHNWTHTPGYPLVTIEKSSKGDNKFVAKQSRYFAFNGNVSSFNSRSDSNDQTWWVPLTILLPNGDVMDVPNFNGPVSSPFTVSAPWFKANANQTGYYRVKYPADMWPLLKTNYPSLTNFDRAGLLDDVLSFLYSGELSPSVALDFLGVLRNERDYIVWASTLEKLDWIFDMIVDLPCSDAVKQYITWLLKPVSYTLDYIPKPTDDHTTGLLKGLINEALIQYQSAESITYMAPFWPCHFSAIKFPYYNCSQESPDIRQAIYSSYVADYGEASFEEVYNLYMNEKNLAEKNRFMLALTEVKNRNTIERALQMSLDEDVIKPQDIATFVEGLASNPSAREMTWYFVKENWDYISENAELPDLIPMLGHFSGEFWYNEFKQFFDKNPPEGAAMTLENALQMVLGNGKWKTFFGDDVCDFANSFDLHSFSTTTI